MHVSTFLLTAFVSLSIFCNVSTTYLQKTEDIDKDDLIIYDKYIELNKNIKNLVNSGIKNALPFVMEANENLNLSSNCARNLFTFLSEVRKLKVSALKFLDASGKLPAGIFTLNLNMFGDYDECLDTKILRADGNVMFKGQYCLINLKAFLPKKKRKITVNSGLEELQEYAKNTTEFMHFLLSILHMTHSGSIKYAACIPTGCTTEDVGKIVKYIGEKAFIIASVEYCEDQHEFQFRKGALVAIIFISIVGLLAVIGSSVDYYSRTKGIHFKKTVARYLICFSVFTNFPKIINTTTQDPALTSLYGIKTLSLFMIIFIHQYYCYGIFQMFGHGQTVMDQLSEFFPQIIYSGFLTVDVFFFLGGLLNTYIRTRMHSEGKQVNPVQIIIHRLWRLYPTYIFCLLVFFLLGNAHGPMGRLLRQEYIKPCEENWWQNILFINNFFDIEKTCMPHTWYVAADMQLFLISLFTVPLLLRNAKKGIILHIGILITGLITTALWAWHKDLMPAMLAHYIERDDLRRVGHAYITFLPHIAPYYTGLIVGFVLSTWKEFKIPGIYRFIGWPIAAACFVSMLYTPQKWNSGVEYTLVESALYFAFSRFLYALAIAWMVICCAKGYGGIINYILSLQIWIPLSRLSYMVYMISLSLQLYYFASLKMVLDVDWMSLIWRHIGDLGVSCLLSLVMVVIMESPFISMEKLIFSNMFKKKENPVNNLENLEKHINNIDIIKETDLVKNEKIEM